MVVDELILPGDLNVTVYAVRTHLSGSTASISTLCSPVRPLGAMSSRRRQGDRP